MAYFAKIDSDNFVFYITHLDDYLCSDGSGNISESKGVEYLTQNDIPQPGTWLLTDITGSFRKNYAFVNGTYSPSRDAFINPRPYNSWVLNESNCKWESPVPMPTDGKLYFWREETMEWVESFPPIND